MQPAPRSRIRVLCRMALGEYYTVYLFYIQAIILSVPMYVLYEYLYLFFLFCFWKCLSPNVLDLMRSSKIIYKFLAHSFCKFHKIWYFISLLYFIYTHTRHTGMVFLNSLPYNSSVYFIERRVFFCIIRILWSKSKYWHWYSIII